MTDWTCLRTYVDRQRFAHETNDGIAVSTTSVRFTVGFSLPDRTYIRFCAFNMK